MKSKDQWFIKIEVPFVDEVSRLAIVKMLCRNAQNAMMLKDKFIQNLATLDVTNSFLETVIFDPKEMLGILDLRLVEYYKIKQGILQENLSKYCRFESADISWERFNKFVNSLKKEKEEMKESYLWCEPDDERRNISRREIIDKYVDLCKFVW